MIKTTAVSTKRVSLALAFLLGAGLASGCSGGGVEEVPKDAPYVPPAPVEGMKPAGKKAGGGGAPLAPPSTAPSK